MINIQQNYGVYGNTLKPSARFQRNGYRFIVKPSSVLVYDRNTWDGEYSMQVSSTIDRETYDSRRYQVGKNQDTIDALQSVMNA